MGGAQQISAPTDIRKNARNIRLKIGQPILPYPTSPHTSSYSIHKERRNRVTKIPHGIRVTQLGINS